MKNSIQNSKNLFSAIENMRLFKLKKKNNLTFIRTLNLRFCTVAVLSLLAFTGCENDSDDLLQEEESIYELHLSADDGIYDGANGGTGGFYFLPPMVKSPSYIGIFDAGLSPVVEIYETTTDETLHASFSMNHGEGSELVRLSEEDGHYIVNWHTDKTGTEVGKTYRIRISVVGIELGYADVQMAENGKDAKNITDGEAIALVDGRTLPIKFRIETGIPGAVIITPAEASIKVGETQQFTAAVSDLHGEPLINSTITWSSEDTNVANIDDAGLTTGIAEGEVIISATSGPASRKAALTVTTGATDAFVTIWDTNLGSGTTIALALSGEVNATIDWGDGTTTTVNEPGPHIHDYGQDGIYTVSVSGNVSAYNSFNNGGYYFDKIKLIEVTNWGNVGFKSLNSAFYGSQNLTAVPINSQGIENVLDMSRMFVSAKFFNQDISGWDTSNVINMSGMFNAATSFNQDIGGWNTANVTNMSAMFNGAHAFNQDIGGWNTANVTNMSAMFGNMPNFNQNIGGWDISKVTNTSQMFYYSYSFNQDISGWNTSNITNMQGMFAVAIAFNQEIGSWNTSNVKDMSGMFAVARAFNQEIGSWDTGNVSEMVNMFRGAEAFNRDIGGWNTASVSNMQGMFFAATSFNQDIGGWDTSNVTNMVQMFDYARVFNQNLSKWCVSLIPYKPSKFDYRAENWVLPRPIWGTCPTN